MTWDLDLKGKTVLEPSAGKGDKQLKKNQNN